MSEVRPVTPPPLPGLKQARWHSVGVWLAIASCVFPVLPIAFLIVLLLLSHGEPSRTVLTPFFWTSQVLCGVCGATALFGMWKWGHRTVWMLACIGLAIGGFMIGMTFAGESS